MLRNFITFTQGACLCATLVACGSETSSKPTEGKIITLPRGAPEPRGNAQQTWARVSGTVAGEPSRLQVAYAAPLAKSDDAYGIALAFSSDPNFCDSALKTTGEYDYMMVAIVAETLEPYQFKLVAGEPTDHGLAAASMVRVRGDAPLARHDAIDGSVTLNAVHHGTFDGELNVRFANGEHITGKFHALTCDKLDPLEL